MARELTLPGRPRPYVMAHRGNRAACPENTLAAFRRALEDGADILETDVHLTADGTFVCIHDATVDRTTDGSGAVAEMSRDELRTFSAAYGRPAFAAERIPTLEEVMALLPEDRALALELKTDRFLDRGVCKNLVSALDAGGVRARTVVVSFKMARVLEVQRAAPDVPIGHISLGRPWPRAGATLQGPFWPLLLINPLYVWWAHRRGQAVCPLDPVPDSRLWLYRALGCDALLTDDPAATLRALGRAATPR